MAELTEEEREILRQAGAIVGRMRSPEKAAAARVNGAKSSGRPSGTGRPMSEETKAKMRTAQQARRERQRAEEGTAKQ